METGFYQPFCAEIEGKSVSGLNYAANCVLMSQCCMVFLEEKSGYNYPTPCGWYWFNSREEAESFFGINNTN